MLKPNFNPMFYNRLVYDIDFGGGGPTPTVSYTPKQAKTTARAQLKTGKERVNAGTITIAKQDCRSTKKALVGRLESKLGKKDKVTTNKMRAEINSYYSTAAVRMSNQMTREQLARHQANIAKKTNEFNSRIENLSELLSHKELSKKELRNVTKQTFTEFQNLFVKEKRYRKNCKYKHMMYVVSAYMLRWENANNKAINRVVDMNIALKIFKDLKERRGGAFKDLTAIKEDIMRVLDGWADAQNNKDERDIYSDNKWDTKYEKTIPSKSLWEKASNYQYQALTKYTLPGMAFRALSGKKEVGKSDVRSKSTLSTLANFGYQAATFGTLPGMAYRALSGKKGIDTYSALNLEVYLKWAREQAKKGKYAPLPDLLRANGGRFRARITAGINPQEVKRSLEFENRADKLQKDLVKAAVKTKIKFGNPNLVEGKDEGTIAFYHQKKGVGTVEIAPQGKVYLKIKKQKIDITAMNPADVIKKIEDLALNPTVKELKVTKVGGKATLRILGDNMPTTKTTKIDLAKASVKLAKLGMNRTDVRLAPNLQNVDANIKKVLKDSLDEYVKNSPKIGPKMKPKITAKLIEELQQKVYPKGTGKKPKLVIRGKADVITGSFNENLGIAKKRAKSALKALKAKNSRLERDYDVEVVAIVVGPDGNGVSKAEGWRKTLKAWNDNPKIKEKVTTIKDLKKKIKNPKAGAQAKFVQNIEDQRGADMLILPPATNTQGYDIVVG
ncbi:hypothetical protein ACFLZH_04870 [Patescibacteria group bacterium]